jgi:DNA-binding CsgD family transcriptional regulator
MSTDITLVEEVLLQTSNDYASFKTVKTLSRSEIAGTFSPFTSLISFTSGLLDYGRRLVDSGECNSFRLLFKLQHETFYIYDAKRADVLKTQNDSVDMRENIYLGLSEREKQLLCFLYRGYRYHQIAPLFSLSVNTLKKYRQNIYSKMKFNTKTELVQWSDEHLEELFNL